MGSTGGGRPARPGGRLPVAEVAIIKLGRHLPGILQCSYHAHLTHFLFAHIIAEVCDVLALVTIAFGLSKVHPVATFVAGAAQHR